MTDIDSIISTKLFAQIMADQNDLFRKNVLFPSNRSDVPKGKIVCTQQISGRDMDFRQKLLKKLIAYNDQPAEPYFEVHQHTFCDGWTNTWSITDEEGNVTPHTFKTKQEAQDEVDDFLKDIRQEIKNGDREEDEGYSPEDFKIVEVQNDEDGFNEDCDPNGWHDMGVLKVDGDTIWFKIDYYDLEYEYGVENPSDMGNTRRVLTLLFPSEY